MTTQFITNEEKFLSTVVNNILPSSENLYFLVGYFYFSGFQEIYKNVVDKNIKILVGLDVEQDILNKIKEVELIQSINDSRGKVREKYYKSLVDLFNETAFFDSYEKQEAFRLFLEKIKNGTLEKEINIDVMDVFQGPDEYHDWWITKSKMIKVPIELQLSAEETASFQIGEIYLKKGEKYLKEKEYGKSEKYYNMAKYCFHEVENYLSLWERRDRHLKNNKQRYYNELRKLDFEKLEFADSQMKILLEVTLKNPICLPLNVRPFQKNPYLEKNIQTCKNALEVIKYKQSVKMDKVKKFKEPITKNMEDITLPNNIKSLIMEGIHKKGLINNHIKISNRESIENKCQKRFPKVYTQLSWESKNEMVKDVLYENISLMEKMFDYLPSIGCLARLLEKEAEITIETILKKHKLNFRFKHNDYKIGKLKSLLESFGQNKLNIDKEEVESVIRDLIQASDFRAPFAHPARGGTHEELKEFRKLLFGRNKEEDGLIFKIIKYREIKKDDCQ